MVEAAHGGERELQRDAEVVLAPADLARVRLFYLAKGRFGRLYQHTKVAQLVLKTLSACLSSVGGGEEVLVEAYVPDTQRLA